ncbi:MAG: phosphonate ABC transporter, permease protein PhnE [Rhodobacteraceae bacterium]|nr:phosphonate ABC transporter, permease protein PhnE [Paracoccaceae bacterium]
MSAALEAKLGQAWKKPPFITNPVFRWVLIGGSILYFVVALGGIEVSWDRIVKGMDYGKRFITAFGGIFVALFDYIRDVFPWLSETFPRFFGPPTGNDPSDSRWIEIWTEKEIIKGLYESIVMTVASTVVGIAISIPIALGAAGNIAPMPIYLFCRAVIALSRALNEIIVAIILVAILGFGPLAGFITLSFATIGFLAKLLAEDIENMNKQQAEAVKSTGSSWGQWINFGVQPQVMPRLIGLSMYRLDINFRESAVLGLVGAGGIGATLNTAFDRYEFDTVAAILLTIIIIVMILEYLSGVIRGRVQ